MSDQLLTAQEAAQQLGVTASSLYDWLRQSDQGTFMIRGERVTINYLQGGAKGQCRIRIEVQEVERLKDLMRVRPQRIPPRRPPTRPEAFPGITVTLGRPA